MRCDKVMGWLCQPERGVWGHRRTCFRFLRTGPHFSLKGTR